MVFDQTGQHVETQVNIGPLKLSDDQLVEKLAGLSHEQWSGWAKWMIEHWDALHISGETFIERWQRQIRTPYAELSEAEKDSDRVEARKMLALIREVTR